jgi:hypothetical protein
VFDVNEDAQMPTTKGSFSGAEEGMPFVSVPGTILLDL